MENVEFLELLLDHFKLTLLGHGQEAEIIRADSGEGYRFPMLVLASGELEQFVQESNRNIAVYFAFQAQGDIPSEQEMLKVICRLGIEVEDSVRSQVLEVVNGVNELTDVGSFCLDEKKEIIYSHSIPLPLPANIPYTVNMADYALGFILFYLKCGYRPLEYISQGRISPPKAVELYRNSGNGCSRAKGDFH